MPRRQTILQVFVASPEDVVEERSSLEAIIDELNKSWSSTLAVRLELIKWETDVQPGFGDDPQDVINKQIKEYDIFIGLFWGRIGTKTLRAQSGSIEEFEKAYSRYKENPENIDIMLYFKEAPIPPSKIDPDQFSSLMKFRSSLSSLGGLYCEFHSLDDFEASLRTHLSAKIQKWANRPEVIEVVEETPNLSDDEDEEYGYFDYLESFSDHNDDMCSALGNLSEATRKMGKNMTKRTEALQDVGDINDRENYHRAKKIVQLTSEDMERYKASVEAQLPILSKSKTGALGALSKALVVYRDFEGNIDEIETLDKSLNGMRAGALEARSNLLKFQSTISNLPRITAQFNRAKKHVVQVLSQVLDEMDSIAQVSSNIIDSIAQLKMEMKV